MRQTIHWFSRIVFAELATGTLACAIVVSAAAEASAAAPHPLDPLSAAEIDSVVKIVRGEPKISKSANFATIALSEPDKSVVYAHKPGAAFPREALVVLHDRPSGRTVEAIVDLKGKKIRSLTERPGAQPAVLVVEYELAGEIVRKDKRWQAAMRKRGLTDEQFDDVVLDPWAAGYIDRPELKGKRLIRTPCYYRGKSNNPYPRVIEGVVALVNITDEEVVEVLDLENIPIPAQSLDYFDAKQIGQLREPLKPLEIKQPNGANFTLQGNEIRWQKWSLRHSFHPREGLVLHAISYDDGGDKPRSILYRASLSEMVVPYADPAGTWSWRNAFDVGEYGLGACLSPMRAGYEVPENATLLLVVLADDLGKPYEVENAVAIYEQDGGVLWTHTDYDSKKVETRRARQLVLHSLFTVGNYDYALRWIFGQDGTIEVQAELSGVLLVKGVKEKVCAVCQQEPDADGRLRPTGADKHGSLVAPQIVATHHQHFFNFRLDFDIEQTPNCVHEMDLVAAEPLADNPLRNAFVLEQRLLRTEREAQRDLDHASHRTWKVLNADRRTALGHFPAYELSTATNALPFAHPQSRVRQRAGFSSHHLWVTQHQPRELYAAGDYPNQSSGGDGLPQYADDNQPLVGQDVVVWYTMGLSHAARAEEWPVMPAARAGFRLVPHNFFDRNPALDVP